LIATAARLLPGFSGSLYVFNNPRDRLDLATRWGLTSGEGTDSLLPTSCWTLKRGRPPMNLLDDGALRGRHATADRVPLEFPMARWKLAPTATLPSSEAASPTGDPLRDSAVAHPDDSAKILARGNLPCLAYRLVRGLSSLARLQTTSKE
jgi:hypothetical protein